MRSRRGRGGRAASRRRRRAPCPSRKFDSPRLAGELGRRGARVELGRRVALADPPVADDRDPVGERERLVLVVGDEDRRRARVAQHPAHVVAHRRAQARVERGERLVQQHERRVDGERPGERDALLLAARELVGIAPRQAGEPDHLEQLGDALARVARVGRRPKPTFCSTVRCGKRLPVLGHVADAAPLGRRRSVAVVDDLAARARRCRGRRARSRRSPAAASSSRCPRARGSR